MFTPSACLLKKTDTAHWKYNFGSLTGFSLPTTPPACSPSTPPSSSTPSLLPGWSGVSSSSTSSLSQTLSSLLGCLEAWGFHPSSFPPPYLFHQNLYQRSRAGCAVSFGKCASKKWLWLLWVRGRVCQVVLENIFGSFFKCWISFFVCLRGDMVDTWWRKMNNTIYYKLPISGDSDQALMDMTSSHSSGTNFTLHFFYNLYSEQLVLFKSVVRFFRDKNMTHVSKSNVYMPQFNQLIITQRRKWSLWEVDVRRPWLPEKNHLRVHGRARDVWWVEKCLASWKNVLWVEKMFVELQKCLVSYKNVWWVTKVFGELKKCSVSWIFFGELKK